MSAAASKPTKPRILVTGAAGYLGGIVVAALAERREEFRALVALDVRPVPAAEHLAGVCYETGDVRSDAVAKLVEKHSIDTVVHFAFLLAVPKNGGASLAYEIDVLGTRNVLEACVANGVTQLVVSSSGAAYGFHADNPKTVDESDPLRGNDEFPYSKHKRLVEELLAEARTSHPDLKQLILRPGAILGEGVSNLITDLFEKRVVPGVAGSEAPFTFIWDKDVAEVVVRGVLGRREGIYNLAGDGVLTGRDIARILGKPYLPIPPIVLRTALKVLQAAKLSQYGPEQVKFLRYRPVLSNRRLKEEFGYVPQLTSREVFDLYARGQA